MSSYSPRTLPVLGTTPLEPFGDRISRAGLTLRRSVVRTVQINVGKLCNQTCTHCHVDAGPTRKRENMSSDVARRIIELVQMSAAVVTIDITGGAPELNPSFRDFVVAFRGQGLEVIDRCNLTILSEVGQEDLADFLAAHQVHVIASLPCYLESNVDSQRGDGVFRRSIAALRELNRLGYGSGGALRLDLVYNPTSAILPPNQLALQADYKRELASRYDVRFDQLLTITNMPVKRYVQYLRKANRLDDYMQLLEASFNPVAAGAVMCRELVSIDWQGRIYDCDFNQMLELEIDGDARDVWSINSFDDYADTLIQTADHCYGCTAGAGSSCTGAVVSP